jgi:hypothetical protein
MLWTGSFRSFSIGTDDALVPTERNGETAVRRLMSGVGLCGLESSTIDLSDVKCKVVSGIASIKGGDKCTMGVKGAAIVSLPRMPWIKLRIWVGKVSCLCKWNSVIHSS